MEEHIADISSWTEVSLGFYRLQLTGALIFEIHIVYHTAERSILAAKADLYVATCTKLPEGSFVFQRERARKNSIVQDCLTQAATIYSQMDSFTYFLNQVIKKENVGGVTH